MYTPRFNAAGTTVEATYINFLWHMQGNFLCPGKLISIHTKPCNSYSTSFIVNSRDSILKSQGSDMNI